MAGLVAHGLNLVSLSLFSDDFLIKLTWVLRNSSGSVRNSLSSEHSLGLVGKKEGRKHLEKRPRGASGMTQ